MRGRKPQHRSRLPPPGLRRSLKEVARHLGPATNGGEESRGRWPHRPPASITSPPALVAMAHQVRGSTPSFTKRTEPSRKPTFTPPGWNELAPTHTALHSTGYV